MSRESDESTEDNFTRSLRRSAELREAMKHMQWTDGFFRALADANPAMRALLDRDAKTSKGDKP